MVRFLANCTLGERQVANTGELISDEEKPSCINCLRQGDSCDYSIRLNWDGRVKKPPQNAPLSTATGDPFRAAFVAVPQNTGKSAGPAQQVNIATHDVSALSGCNEVHRRFSSPPPDRFKLTSASERHIIQTDGFQRPAASVLSGPHNNTGQAWISPDIPLAPTHASETANETVGQQSGGTPSISLGTDVQRVSVQSLLSPSATAQPFLVKSSESGRPDTAHYGYDCGRWDMDLNMNDDLAAIQREIPGESPTPTIAPARLDVLQYDKRDTRTAFAKGGYYAQPVPINIPQHLSPLPPALHENPIHLLYFHHFMNHTAKILVPHACANNPFEHVLPASKWTLSFSSLPRDPTASFLESLSSRTSKLQPVKRRKTLHTLTAFRCFVFAVAVQDENVLSMLFAYSASHRARLLGHAEPYCRIAHWTRDVFTNLRRSLDHAEPRISDTSLAAAIMLLSLKIISPTTFEAPITWQSHLKLARELFVTRNNVQRISAADKVGSFLGRWLGYLDIMGSLSSRDTGAPLFGGNYWSTERPSAGQPRLDEDELEIDCFTGFTPRCRQLLARLAELMHECDLLRFNSISGIDHGPALPATLLGQAEHLLGDFKVLNSPEVLASRRHHGDDDSDIAAVDDAYRLAGVVQLYRRVLGPRYSRGFEVGDAVGALVAALDSIPHGGSAEVCCLFPLFTAGCETDDPVQRQDICNRVKGFEGVGMKQVTITL